MFQFEVDFEAGAFEVDAAAGALVVTRVEGDTLRRTQPGGILSAAR